MIAGHSPAIWLIFALTVGLLLAVDLVFVARGRTLAIRSASWWSLAVIAAAALFGVVVWSFEGRGEALQFATGYVVEFSLSVDNLLVFIMILHYFAVPEAVQPTVLKWGILGAIVMRAIVIAAGALILNEFHWVTYLFGVLLVATAARMLARPSDESIDPEKNAVVRLVRRLIPVSADFAGRAFFTRREGKLGATPLLLVVVLIEWTDVVFATDSIPAIFAITRDPFLIYTSNVFAIVGLRALFFVLAAMLTRFAYLRFGVATVLMLVGIKMLVAGWVVIPTLVSLLAIVGVLGVSVALSPRARV